MADWKIFVKSARPHDRIDELTSRDGKAGTELKTPPWRRFDGRVDQERRLPRTPAEAEGTNLRGATFEATDDMVEMVNAALYLRRPLLLTGKPGSGKSSLIYAVARQLKLGDVLRWPITSRSTLREALYEYDALGRMHQQQLTPGQQTNIGDYLVLGPLGTALLPTNRPRALLIDEIDKSDLDLPNDLLNIFEEGEFEIPELARLRKDQEVIEIRAKGGNETFPIKAGHVRCREFPFVVMTSNGEREFPAPFLRRCLRLTMPDVDDALLKRIVTAHLGGDIADAAAEMITKFASRAPNTALATDQLLNAVFMISRQGLAFGEGERERILDALQRELASPSPVTPA
jgi:MoxR-like ATPase